jgi:hypothetical protein
VEKTLAIIQKIRYRISVVEIPPWGDFRAVAGFEESRPACILRR